MDALHAYTSRRMLALGAIGFASGLPFMLTQGTLQQWMTDRGVDLTTIGVMSLVTVPYALKVLWAPFLDRWRAPLLGPRRGWLLIIQILLMASIAALALLGPRMGVWGIGVAALMIAFFSASQDIVADGYRTDVLTVRERGYGAALFVTGYRVAMLATGAGAAVLVGRGWMTWSQAYLMMAGIMGIGVLGTLFADEPDNPPEQPPTLYRAIVPPLAEFLSRRDGVLVLLFILLFRLPDSVAGWMTVPFLLDIGVTDEQIGYYRHGLGVGTTIIGTMLGGAIVGWIGLRASLWLFGIMQAVSNVGFLLLAYTGAKLGVLIGVLVVENLCAGFAVAGFFVFLMSQCHRQFTVTQYALLSSLMALMMPLMGSWTGAAAKGLGWRGFFLLSIATSVPALALLLFIRPRDQEVREAERIAEETSIGQVLVESA